MSIAKTDEEYFSSLLYGVLTNVAELEQQIQPYLDRPFKELSPVEIAILLLGTHELAEPSGNTLSSSDQRSGGARQRPTAGPMGTST